MRPQFGRQGFREQAFRSLKGRTVDWRLIAEGLSESGCRPGKRPTSDREESKSDPSGLIEWILPALISRKNSRPVRFGVDAALIG
jgi:hypothetical protein